MAAVVCAEPTQKMALTWNPGTEPRPTEPVECCDCGEMLQTADAPICDIGECINIVLEHMEHITCPANDGGICEGCSYALCGECVARKSTCLECWRQYCTHCFRKDDETCKWCHAEEGVLQLQ
jgi:hypothetical protein